MRLTVDSKDPLAEVLAVVGAMYGVRLQAVDDPPALAAVADDAPGAPADAAAPRRAGGRRRAAAAEAAQPRASARAPRTSGGGAVVDSAAVRAWARENGLEVSARGRLSSSVVAAYRDANG